VSEILGLMEIMLLEIMAMPDLVGVMAMWKDNAVGALEDFLFKTLKILCRLAQGWY